MKLPKVKKTTKIFKPIDGSVDKFEDCKFEVVAELDYPDFLQYRLKLLEEDYKGGLYVENKHGGYDEMNEFVCIETGSYPFDHLNDILYKIIVLQMDKRKKVYLKEKENDGTSEN